MSVQAIIDNAIAVADRKGGQAEAYGGQAVNSATGNGDVIVPTIAGSISVRDPGVSIPSRATGTDTALWNATYDRIFNDFINNYADFMAEYFPVNAALMAAVENWLTNAVTNGGTGINATVESQIWQRDRDRITIEAASAESAAVAGWAARGFPLPPGAAVGAVQDIINKRNAAVAAVSRDAAIKAFEAEIENVRFAITTAVDYRIKAVSAAGDYIKALAVAPQLAPTLSTAAGNAQAALISAAASYYNARINAEELALKKNITQAEMIYKGAEQSAQNRVEYTGLRVQAATAVAQSLGQQAAAAINAINATSQLIESVG
jgi:hypothetical protein